MASNMTPNLGLTLPIVGASTNIWGNQINGDLTILDTLAVCPVVNVSSSYTVPISNAVETIIRVTTGSVAVTITLPAPTTVGKIYTIIKVDNGVGTVSIIPASGSIGSNPSWIRANQWAYLRAASNGVGYDPIGYN